MTIGRLQFGLIEGSSCWSYIRGSCRCRIFSLGRVYFTLLDKECKCDACKQYECKCQKSVKDFVEEWKDEDT
jgi:hypothetical protein